MSTGNVQPGPRLATAALLAALALSIALPAATLATATDPELIVTLELPAGDVDYDLELGTLHVFDGEDVPFVVSVIDGCDVNDRLWVVGAGLSGIPVPMTVRDLRSGRSARTVLPAYEAGLPIGTVIEPEALPVCGDDPTGGLPALSGTAILTSADGRGGNYPVDIELRSDGSADSYRRLVRGGSSFPIISKGSPVVAVDDSIVYDELVLLAEGRTPRKVEGVVFRGPEGMLPARASLARALTGINRSRVRRAFETAKNVRVPRGIIDELGLSGVDQVQHLSLDLDTLGADAYLAKAGWIRERGRPIEPPVPVDARFSVEVARASGGTEEVPLVGPLVGSAAAGRLWEHRSPGVLVQIVDACDLGGSFWTFAGAATNEPLELIVTDTETGDAAKRLLWTDREDVSRLSDGAALTGCP
jgi:hypothetical protein